MHNHYSDSFIKNYCTPLQTTWDYYREEFALSPEDTHHMSQLLGPKKPLGNSGRRKVPRAEMTTDEKKPHGNTGRRKVRFATSPLEEEASPPSTPDAITRASEMYEEAAELREQAVLLENAAYFLIDDKKLKLRVRRQRKERIASVDAPVGRSKARVKQTDAALMDSRSLRLRSTAVNYCV